MTSTEKLQAEAEQLYPLPYANFAACWGSRDIAEFKRAAHLACAEKYTAIIEQKDKEIERLRDALHLILGEPDYDSARAVLIIKRIAKDAIQNEKTSP